MISPFTKCAISQIILVLLLGCDSVSETEDDAPIEIEISHGLKVAAENRCSTYDGGDYSYPQSVEQLIVDKQDGIFSPYDLQCFQSTSETDIEHIVATSEAHDSGLCSADAETKRTFARDLDNLTLASPRLNRNVKGAKDAGEWLPENNQCWYVHTIVQVKKEYDLTVDPIESVVLDRLLMECGKDTVMVKPSC